MNDAAAIRQQMASVKRVTIDGIIELSERLMCCHNLALEAVLISPATLAMLGDKATINAPAGPVAVYCSSTLKRWEVRPIWRKAGDVERCSPRRTGPARRPRSSPHTTRVPSGRDA